MAKDTHKCKFIPISQPEHEHEAKALRRIRDLLDESDFESCYLISGFYLEKLVGPRSRETDALIVCDYGVYIIELKDWFGSITIPRTNGSKIICTDPCSLRR